MGGAQTGDFSGLSLLSGIGFSGLTVGLLILLALLFSCYVRIVTVLGIVRAGFGVSGLPAAFVTTGLALGLSFFVMYPTLHEAGSAIDSITTARGAALNDNDRVIALTRVLTVWKRFLLRHTSAEERERFARIAMEYDHAPSSESSAGQPEGENAQGSDASQLERRGSTWQVLAPAFITSEIRIAFATGLALLLPFIVIDLLVAMVMAAMGVDTLNAALVALPFKLLLFIVVDGWSLITTNLVASYIT